MPDHRETSPTSNARTREWLEICERILPAREWTVWNALEVQGETAMQLALRLKINERSVRGLLHRARLRILAWLIDSEE